MYATALTCGLPSGPEAPEDPEAPEAPEALKPLAGLEPVVKKTPAGYDRAALSLLPTAKPFWSSLRLPAGLLGAGCHLVVSVRMACHGTQRRWGRSVLPTKQPP